jgi:hypothetical protein
MQYLLHFWFPETHTLYQKRRLALGCQHVIFSHSGRWETPFVLCAGRLGQHDRGAQAAAAHTGHTVLRPGERVCALSLWYP